MTLPIRTSSSFEEGSTIYVSSNRPSVIDIGARRRISWVTPSTRNTVRQFRLFSQLSICYFCQLGMTNLTRRLQYPLIKQLLATSNPTALLSAMNCRVSAWNCSLSLTRLFNAPQPGQPRQSDFRLR